MASWTKKTPTGPTARRKWNLDDRTTLNNLKYHIAQEGCSEVQYDLAKQLLDKNLEQNEASSSEQAVYWLLSAASQGHDSALELLEECYRRRRGITHENECEVRRCLMLTPGERAARKAAKELFACLSNGGDHITPKKLERKMRKIYKMQKNRRHRNNSSSEEGDTEDNDSESGEPLEHIHSVGGENSDLSHTHQGRAALNISDIEKEDQRLITEENLVSAAANYSAGHMPPVNESLTLSVPHPATLDHIPCFHRLFFHPIIFCTLLYHRFINFVSSFPTCVPPSVRISSLLVAYWLLPNDNIAIFLPVTFYYLCFIVMIWATCKMLKTNHDFIDFHIWSGLFLSYGDNNIETDMSENRFLKNNMKPYLYFFCAFICNLMVHPLVATEWLPHSEITIVSCVFVFATLLSFMYTSTEGEPDWLILVSFGVNVLAKYPYEMDEVVTTGWRFLDLKVPTFCSFVIGNGIEFCLNCRTALYLLIPGFLVQLAKRTSWHGTYRHLIPHCVTLSWLQLSITSSRGATGFGVLRATLGLAGMLLFLPLFGIVSLLVPVFVAIDWMGLTDSRIRWGTAVGAVSLTLLGSCFLAVNRWTQKYITSLQVFICIIAASILTLPYMTVNFKDVSRFGSIPANQKETIISTASMEEHNLDVDGDHLTWQQFCDICGPPTWEQHNKIRAQLRCAQLNGMQVLWEGTVKQVQISRVTNLRAEYIRKLLPDWLASTVECFYGDDILSVNVCNFHFDPLCAEMQRALKNSDLEKKCSLHKWNSYDYEVIVTMSSGLLSTPSDVVLHGSHYFGNFSSRLLSGDHIQFFGSLLNSRVQPNGRREDFLLGTSNTHVQLAAIKCILCQNNDIIQFASDIPAKSSMDERRRDLMRGIKYFLNVLFNPLITFK